MDISIHLSRKTIYQVIALTVLSMSVLLVTGFDSGGPPSFFGHSPEEVQSTVPAGAVMYFNLAACPSGWTAIAGAEGRYLVGKPSGGTLAGTSGTALTNLESRPVGAHSHSISDPSHSHGTSVSDPGHSHIASSSVSDPGHSHTFGCQSTGIGTIPYAGNTGPTATCSTASSTTGISVTTTTSGATTGISVGTFGSGTGISVLSTGAVAGTNAPYIQYLVCQKS